MLRLNHKELKKLKGKLLDTVVEPTDMGAIQKMGVRVDYVGRILEQNDFLLGYGLDYNEFERNIPYVYIPTEEEIAHFDELGKK